MGLIYLKFGIRELLLNWLAKVGFYIDITMEILKKIFYFHNFHSNLFELDRHRPTGLKINNTKVSFCIN